MKVLFITINLFPFSVQFHFSFYFPFEPIIIYYSGWMVMALWIRFQLASSAFNQPHIRWLFFHQFYWFRMILIIEHSSKLNHSMVVNVDEVVWAYFLFRLIYNSNNDDIEHCCKEMSKRHTYSCFNWKWIYLPPNNCRSFHFIFIVIL